MTGWIKLHRKMLDWEWYSDVPTKLVFMHLLLIVNREATTYRGKSIPKGGKVIGRKKISVDTGLSEQQVRTALSNLQSTKDINMQSTNAFSVVSIVDWAFYQEGEAKATNDQPADTPPDNPQITTEQEIIINNTTVVTREEIPKIIGWDKSPTPWSLSGLDQWIANGWDYELDILPTIRRLMQNKRGPPPKTLKYFEQAIADAHAERHRPLPKGNPNASTSGNQTRTDKLKLAKQRALEELGVGQRCG